MKKFNDDGMRLTDCCGAASKFMDGGRSGEVLCCKKCYEEVAHGEGDGSEYEGDRHEAMKATMTRDKIVLIVERDNTDPEVIGPFATRKAAQEAEDEMEKNWDEYAWSHVRGCTIATMQPVGSE